MNPFHRARAQRGIALFASIALLAPVVLPSATAGTLWDGGGTDSNWGTGANWSPDGSPPVGATVDLTFGGSTKLTPFNNYTPFDDFHSLTFAAGAGAFTLQGNAVDLFGKIENLSTVPQTVALASIAINGGQGGTGEFNPVNGNLVIQSANVFTNGNPIRIFGANQRTVTFSAGTVISQGGGVIIEQANNVVFHSAHLYTGDTVVKAGGLFFEAGGSAEASTIRLGDTIANSPAALVVLFAPAGGQVITSGIVVQPSASGSQGTRFLASANTTGLNTFAGNLTLNADLTVTASEAGGTFAITGSALDLRDQTLTVAGAGSTTISGVLGNTIGTGKLTKTGAGTLTLSAANVFAGQLTVAEGTLSVPQWNDSNSSGPLGNSALPVSLGGAATTGILRFTGGGSNNAPASIKPLLLNAGGGRVEMVYAAGNRNANYIHINGDRLTGPGGLTVDTFAGGATSRFIVIGSAAYTGATVVAPNSELQTNYSNTVDVGTPFGAGLNGLGSAVTVQGGGLLTFFSFGVDATVALGSLAGSGTIQGEGGGTHTFRIGGANTDSAFSGTIINNGGPVAITKVGTGTLTLSGNNTHTGTVAIEGGAITVPAWNQSGAPGPWGALANNLGAVGTTFIQMRGGRINFAGPSASGALRGVNLVSGDNTIDIIPGSTLTFAGGFNTFQSNGGNLIKTGGGTLALGTFGIANNVFTGKAVVQAGTLDWFGAGSMPAPAALVPDFLTIHGGATFALTYPDAPTTVPANIGVQVLGDAGIRVAGSHTIAGIVANGLTPGGIAKAGPGTLGLTGANTFTGSVAVQEGTLSINEWNNAGVAGPLGAGTAPVSLGGAFVETTLRYAGPSFLPDSGKKGLLLGSGGGRVLLAMGPDRNSYAHIDGASIAGSGGLTVQTGGARFLVIGSAAYTGPTVVAANSELQANFYDPANDGTPFGAGFNGLGSAVTLGDNSLLTVYSNGANTTIAIGSLSGTGTVRGEATGTHVLKVGGAGTSTTFAGAIQDSFNAPAATALTKVGAGTLTLAGTSTHTGATVVTAGTLRVDGALVNSPIAVLGGTLGGSGGTLASADIQSGGTFAPGAGIGLLNVTGSLTLAGTAAFELGKAGLLLSNDEALVTGALTLGGLLKVTATGDALALGDSFDLFDAGSFNGTFASYDLPGLSGALTWDTTQVATNGTLSVVPEPSAAVALLAGMGVLGFARRRLT